MGIPFEGDDHTIFANPNIDGDLLCTGYTRILFGDHGPYVEMDPEQVNWSSFHIHRNSHPKRHYDAWYTTVGTIKLYVQLRTVANKLNPPRGFWSAYHDRPGGYADYKIGKVYMSADLVTVRHPMIAGEWPRTSGDRRSFVAAPVVEDSTVPRRDYMHRVVSDSMHRPKIKPRWYPFNAAVARPVGKAEVRDHPKAQAAVKEWDRLRNPRCVNRDGSVGVWDESIVREWSDIARQARSQRKTVHMGHFLA